MSNPGEDANIDAELREAVQEDLRRERENQQTNQQTNEEGANTMAGETYEHEEVNEEHLDGEVNDSQEEYLDSEEEPAQDEEEQATPTISEMFAGESSIRLRIAPRIMLNVTANAAGDVPDVVQIGNQYYSVGSPLRKSKGRNIGSKKNPHGLIRDNIGDLASFIGSLRDTDVLLFGAASDIETRVTDLMDYLDGEARNIMYSVFGDFEDEKTPVFTFRDTRPSEVEPAHAEGDDEEDEEEESDLDNVGVTEVSATAEIPPRVSAPATDSFTVHSWPVFDTDEDGSVVLRPTIAININVPLLLSASDIVKPMSSMAKIASNYAKAAGLDEDDFRVTYAFDSGDLLDDTLLNLLHAHASEDSESVIISGSYLDRCVADHNNDVYRVFPTGRNSREARELLLSNGGDTLLLL